MRLSCNQPRNNASRFPSGLECKTLNDRPAGCQSREPSAARRPPGGARWGEGGTRRKDNNPCSSFSTAEKTKEPSGFCVAKSSPCRMGLRQVTDHGSRFKIGPPSISLNRRWSSHRFARLAIVKCVECGWARCRSGRRVGERPEVARPELARLAIGGCIDAGRTAGCGRA
jgi:hypothetical protein